MRIVKLLLFALVALSASCVDDKPPVETVKAAMPPAQKTVFDTQLKALEKAKAVQGVVDKQKRDADKKMEDQGG
jgi:hypothetical protein